ncbi:SDR family NAD(P)-dependent oxidoreductase [Amycolatopsis regifaucium]|uniref:Short-chain dehydrogenase n=1 Tax=Amycolatopsis regifaucium TaxID=546365 RepID=A0A154MQH7_9PSEU|nr:SDR family oxidoreductase [Amycolatopsis regifaucium]KZB86515.1 short-chain dehydrogenase [Amycolatopsis regifaucium]OKA03459.1 short-chain dehydrogenase [Amycolatopsis regifaucium]SFJ13551.1 Short-chain dehydrogenase [Amycolatopsis regifaucium]
MRDSTVLITGGAKGLGRAFTEALGQAGARVFITGRDTAALQETVEKLAADGILVEAVRADVTDGDAMKDVVARIMDVSGRLDVLVNNAVDPGPAGPTADIDFDAWWRTQQVNVAGPLLSAQAALAVMIPAGRGRIINLVSPAGIKRWPYATAYSVSKAALLKLSENLAAELRSTGVTVLSYNPGIVDAGLTRAGIEFAGTTDDPWLARLGRWAIEARDSGAFTPLDTAVKALVRLARGDADVLAGLVINAEDDLDTRISERKASSR